MKRLEDISRQPLYHLILFAIFTLLLWYVWGSPANADVSPVVQTSGPTSQVVPASADTPTDKDQWGMVVIDGRDLFRVTGVKTYSAQKRARDISKKIKRLAENSSFDPDSLKVVEDDGVYTVLADDMEVVSIYYDDVLLEGNLSPEKYLKTLVRESIVTAIKYYRHEQLPGTLKNNAFKALTRSAGLILILILLFWSFKKTDYLLERRFKRKIERLESKSKRILQAQQIWTITRFIIRLTRIAVVLLVIYVFLNFVLGLFPWTRYFAQASLDLVINPLNYLLQSFIDYIPSLFFLIVIYFVIRYLLSFTKAFFQQVDRGQFKVSGFDAEWALPTYRIVRGLIIILTIVIASLPSGIGLRGIQGYYHFGGCPFLAWLIFPDSQYGSRLYHDIPKSIQGRGPREIWRACR